MGRPKSRTAHDTPPAQRAQESTPPSSAPMPSGSASASTISKAEAVRRAVDAGAETPSEGVAYVWKHFHIAMDNKTFSLNRSQQKMREAKQSGRAAPAPTPKPAIATPATSQAGGDIISDIESIKHLLGKHGKDGLRRLVDALG